MEMNLRRYALIQDKHIILEEPPMMKGNTQEKRPLAINNRNAFSASSSIQLESTGKFQYSYIEFIILHFY